MRAIPILAFHGKADRVNTYELTGSSRPYWHMGVETALEKWREADGCGDNPQITKVSAELELRTWPSCKNGAELAIYVDADDDHVWPEGASERIWEFFKHHSL